MNFIQVLHRKSEIIFIANFLHIIQVIQSLQEVLVPQLLAEVYRT